MSSRSRNIILLENRARPVLLPKAESKSQRRPTRDNSEGVVRGIKTRKGEKFNKIS
jgi:hypothetical protein